VVLISIQQSAFGIQPAGGVTRMKNFRDLRVWQKAHQLALGAYAATMNFLRQEIYGLSSQIRRCAVSIPANIAEGCGKRGNAEFQRFLGIAPGSASELEYHFLLANDLDFLPEADYRNLASAVTEIKRMLTSLIRKVESDRLAI
jgi:four helix bundle protein